MTKEIFFRKALLSDIPFLLKLKIETMEMHLRKQGIHLSIEQHKERVLYKLKDAKIVLYKNQEIGLIKTVESQMGYEIKQFQIDKKYQGKGIGENVLYRLIEKANKGNTSIKLSVLKENRAQFLYKKVGFIKVGEDKNSFFMKKRPNPEIALPTKKR